MGSKWKRAPISKIAILRHGYQFRDYDFVEEGIDVIKIGQVGSKGKVDLSKSSKIAISRLSEFKGIQLKNGDVLMALTGATLGKTAIVKNIDKPLVQNYRVGYFDPINSEQINKLFLYYQLTSEFIQNEILGFVNAGAQGNIGKADFEKIQIAFPSLPQQRKIAKILSTCDAVIEKTEAAIAKYQAIKQGMMQDLFTRGIDLETGKLRPSYIEAPELYKPSDLGMIPKEWELEKLESITTKIGDGIHTTPEYVHNSQFRFINGNNLNNGKIEINSSTSCVSEKEYKKYQIELADNTILYSINGTIGKIAFYNGEAVILGKSAAYICFKKPSLMGYVYYYLQTEMVNRFYNLELTGSTIKNLSLAAIRDTPILMPKKEELECINKRLNVIVFKLNSEQSALFKFQQIKAGLMQDLLTGKIEVKTEALEKVDS